MPKKDPVQNQQLDTLGILKALNHYNLHSNKKEAKKFLAEYLTEQGKTTFLLKDLKHLKDEDFQEGTGYVARILTQGNSIPEISEENFNQQVKDIGYKIQKSMMELPDQKSKPVNAVQADPILEYDEFCARYGDIEFQIDVAIAESFQNLDFDMSKWLEGHKVKPKDIKYMIAQLSSLLDEIEEALSSKDKDLSEGYNCYSKPQIKRYSKMLKAWIQECEEHLVVPKRKPRMVKPKTPEQLVKNVRYQESEIDLSLVSIPPEEIIGAKEVWLYNTKHRDLMYYYSLSGLTIRGTTVYDYDRCNAKKLRNPDVQLGEIVAHYNFDDRLRWFNSIGTRNFEPNGRINTNTIIYKVFNK